MGLLEELKKKQGFERTALGFDALAAAYYAVVRAFRREKNTIRETEPEWAVKALAAALAYAEAEAAEMGVKRERLKALRADGEELGLTAHAPGVVPRIKPCFVCGWCKVMPPGVMGYLCGSCQELMREVVQIEVPRDLVDAQDREPGDQG